MNTDQSEWLADLYQSHFRAVQRVCAGVLRNSEDAADASQEVFLTAARSLQPETSRQASRAWLLTVARNHCLDLLRRQKRFGRALATLGGDSDLGPDVETAVANRDLVDSVFKQLSTRERQALWHSAVEQRSLADIAQRLRLSYMAAAQVVHRARQHALATATRVAIALGIIRLTERRQHGSLLGAQQLLVAAAIPIIVVAMQSSGPSGAVAASAATQRTSPVVAGSASQSGQPTGALPGSVSPGQSLQPSSLPTLPGGALPAGATSALSSAANAVKQSVGQLGGNLVTTPSLPSASVPPLPNPSVPPLPSPPIP